MSEKGEEANETGEDSQSGKQKEENEKKKHLDPL